jgi:hypothetical protein
MWAIESLTETPREPTAEECEHQAVVYQDEAAIGYAIWYPQMGGYVGKAVAMMSQQIVEWSEGVTFGGCVEVYVWHDGEFPFNGKGDPSRRPILIHHCDPSSVREVRLSSSGDV